MTSLTERPTGAMCAAHEVAAEAICSRCGAFACDYCIVSRSDSQITCRACEAREHDRPSRGHARGLADDA